jgi:predicted RNA binding protein YcfA (HicA-like mRNA interferase family)
VSPKLPVLSSKEIISALKKAGFINAPKRGKGSHRAFCKNDQGRIRLVIVPERKEVPKGTLLAILEQAGLSKEELLELLK